MKCDLLTPRFVTLVPEPLEPGVLYVSLEYDLAIHLCPCGCGEDVVTPLGEHGWEYKREGDEVTLHPSLLNRFACKSHYFIVKNRIQWC